jgi:hypothetical protein
VGSLTHQVGDHPVILPQLNVVYPKDGDLTSA